MLKHRRNYNKCNFSHGKVNDLRCSVLTMKIQVEERQEKSLINCKDGKISKFNRKPKNSWLCNIISIRSFILLVKC